MQDGVHRTVTAQRINSSTEIQIKPEQILAQKSDIHHDKWPVMAQKQQGAGTVIAFSGSSLFTDTSIGSTTMQPSVEQRKKYELEYWLFRDVLGINQNEITKKE